MDILELKVSDIIVADSINILKDKFQEKIKKTKESIENFQSSINNASEENESLDPSTIDNLAQIAANESMIQLYRSGLSKSQAALKRAQQQKITTLEKYKNLDKNKVLVKKAVTTFSYLNSKLDVRQERTKTLVLSKGGTKVLGLIYNFGFDI